MPFRGPHQRGARRYLREPAKHPGADQPWLWLGKKGRLADSGNLQLVLRRGEDAGPGRIHPHPLRHSFAHQWLSAGGNKGDLMRLAAGGPAKCSSATPPRPSTSGPGTPTAACRSGTGCKPRSTSPPSPATPTSFRYFSRGGCDGLPAEKRWCSLANLLLTTPP